MNVQAGMYWAPEPGRSARLHERKRLGRPYVIPTFITKQTYRDQFMERCRENERRMGAAMLKSFEDALWAKPGC